MTERNQLRLKTEEEMTEEKLVDGAKAAQAIFSPAPAPFNFDSWKTETLNGLRSMEAERETLRQEAQRIAERIVFLDHDIDALRAVAESFTDPDDAKRDSMVKTTLEGLALGIVEWTNLEGV